MKKFAFLFLVFVLVFSISCSQRSDPLSYQQGEFEYRARLTLTESSAEYTVKITKDADGVLRLTFESPEELALISFVKDREGITAYCTDTPWKGMSFPYAEAVFDLFSIDSSAFLSAEHSEVGEIPVCIAEFSGGLSVTIDCQDNSPLVLESESIRLTVIR